MNQDHRLDQLIHSLHQVLPFNFLIQLSSHFLFFYFEDYEEYFEREKAMEKWYVQEHPSKNDFKIMMLYFQMEEELRSKFKEEFDAGIKIVKKWAFENDCLRTIFNECGLPSKTLKVYALFDLKSEKRD